MSAIDKLYYTLIAIVLVPSAAVVIACGIYAWWKVFESMFMPPR